MSRKIFLIIVGVLIAVIIGSLLYLFVFSTKTTEVPPTPQVPITAETSPSPTPSPKPTPPVIPEVAKVIQVIENRVLGFALTPEEIVYYDQDQGVFYKANQDGTDPQPYSQAQFTNVARVIWSPDKTQAILGFGNGSYYHLDLTSGASTKLMPNISNLSWLPQGNKIVYQWNENENEAQLIISEPDGDNWEKIKDLGYTQIILSASPEIGGPVVYLQSYSYGSGRNIYPVYQDGSAGMVLKLEGYGEKAKWGRDGRRVLFEATDAETYDNYLWVVDVTGTNQYNLGVKSFEEKCVWNKTNDKLYCAVPSEALGPEASAEEESIDNFWEIDTKTGEKRKLYDESESEAKFDAEDLWLNLQEDRLYFTDAGGGVYALRLD